MANDFYNVATDLQPFTRARSGVLDTEFAGISAGFDKLPSESRVLSGNSNFVTAGGTANAITVSAPTTWTSYSGKDGYKLSIKITTANTGAVTLNVDGLGTKVCVRLDGDALAADDLQVNGIYDFFYNNTTGKFHVAAWNSFVTDAETAATNAAASETNAASSASSASSSASSASTSATTATNYATKTDGYAAGTDNSAKSWATGGTGDGDPTAGSAKDWATKAEDSTVDGTNFSALHWAAKAEGFAQGLNLPSASGNGGKLIQQKDDETGFRYIELFSNRNVLINGNFAINQREYVSSTATSGANEYTLDRWRVVVSGQSLVFSASGSGNEITAPAGGVEQEIDGANIEGGIYTLSWTGTATATVNGSAITSGGQTASLTAGSNVTIRFSGGTVSKAQLERGSIATPFEQRHTQDELAMCQRYFTRIKGCQYSCPTNGSAVAIRMSQVLPVAMRASPTATLSSTSTTNASFDGTPVTATQTAFILRGTTTTTSGAAATLAADADLDAEL